MVLLTSFTLLNKWITSNYTIELKTQGILASLSYLAALQSNLFDDFWYTAL